MTQGERYAEMCIHGWTSYRFALVNGCGNSPWKRWQEWREYNACRGETKAGFCTYYHFQGHGYHEKTRTREVLTMDGKKTRILERRLIRVK